MRSPRPSTREKPVQQRRPITTQKINKHNYLKKKKRTLTKSNQDAKDLTACSVMGTALSRDSADEHTK